MNILTQTLMIQEAQAGVAPESGQVNLPHTELTQMNATFGNRPSQVINRRANLDNVFTDAPKESTSPVSRTLQTYMPRGDSDLTLSRVGIPQDNISENTVVASSVGNRIAVTLCKTEYQL